MTDHVTVTPSLTVDVGDHIELDAAFVDTAETSADPTTVTFALTDPDGTTTSYVHGVDTEVTNPATGRFILLVVATTAGEWVWTVTGTGNDVEAAEAGSVAVTPAPTAASAAYDRWGMDVETAIAVTGTAAISSARLEQAEEEIVDALGWRPDPDNYGSADPAAHDHDVRVRAFGRAVAWQAAYRADTVAAATDGTSGGIVSESIGGNYDVEYNGAQVPDDRATIVARARTLLARGGWFAPVKSGRSFTLPR